MAFLAESRNWEGGSDAWEFFRVGKPNMVGQVWELLERGFLGLFDVG